mmetsp:Transcript_47591/g.101604  ORF Transcript_47591/g.101604 Transcript_47591/m.101604 type:complete len:366 (-) Transcript_47591:166-1263(-)
MLVAIVLHLMETGSVTLKQREVLANRLKDHEHLFGRGRAWQRSQHDQNCTGWIKLLGSGHRGKPYEMGGVAPGWRVFSQSAQDGIIRAIFDRIGETNRQFVEFGFGYEKTEGDLTDDDMDFAMSGLNTRLLAARGWSGTYFDAATSSQKYNIRRAILSEDNIFHHFEAAGVRKDVDYVSIDVDSIDVWLLHGLLSGGYRPRLISCEYNANFQWNQAVAANTTWREFNWRSMFGASAAAFDFVGRKFGYELLYLMPYFDLFLVRSDVLRAACDLDTVPTLEQQAIDKLPTKQHFPCQLEDAKWMVDVPLWLAGKPTAASSSAARAIVEADRALAQLKQQNRRPKCCQRTGSPICTSQTITALRNLP